MDRLFSPSGPGADKLNQFICFRETVQCLFGKDQILFKGHFKYTAGCSDEFDVGVKGFQ